MAAATSECSRELDLRSFRLSSDALQVTMPDDVHPLPDDIGAYVGPRMGPVIVAY